MPAATPSDRSVSTDSPAGPIRAVVFDLDGTLVDSSADITRAVNLMLAGYGLPAQTVPYVERFIGAGPRQLITGVYGALGVEVSPERLEADTETYVQNCLRYPVVDATLFRDAGEALPALHGAGIKLGICTNKVQRLSETVLDKLGVLQYMDVVIGVDTLGFRKPDPRHLLATLDKLGVQPHEALYIGDTAIDAECAHRADVECLLVEWAAPELGEKRLGRFTDLLDLVKG